MSKSIYFATVLVAGAFLVTIQGELVSGVWVVPSWLAVLAAGLLWQRSMGKATRDSSLVRSYEASSDAAYAALCGALVELGYTIATRSSSSHTLEFRGGKLGPWIGRYGVSARASVRETPSRNSEIVIEGHLSLDEKDGAGMLAYPEGMRLHAAKIFDHVAKSVVTYAMTDEFTKIEDGV